MLGLLDRIKNGGTMCGDGAWGTQLMDLGVRIIGGCCGTGPDHIRAIRAAIDHRITAS